MALFFQVTCTKIINCYGYGNMNELFQFFLFQLTRINQNEYWGTVEVLMYGVNFGQKTYLHVLESSMLICTLKKFFFALSVSFGI